MKIILAILILISPICSYATYEKFNIEHYKKPIPFPESAFLDQYNQPHLMEEFDGSVVLLTLWASWCQVCVNELPVLDMLQKKFLKKPIKILALSEDFKGMEKVQEFYKQYQIKYLDPYLDPKNSIFNQLGVVSLPTSFVINSSGEIVAKITGEADFEDERIIELLLELAAFANVNYNKKPAKEVKVAPVKEEKKAFEIPAEAITYVD